MKLTPLVPEEISRIKEFENSLKEHEVLVNIQLQEEKLFVVLQNGKATSAELLPCHRVFHDISRLCGYKSGTALAKLKPSHRFLVLKDAVQFPVKLVGVYSKDEELQGFSRLSGTPILPGWRTSNAAESLYATKEKYAIRNLTLCDGKISAFFVKEEPVDIIASDPWYGGIVVNADIVNPSQPLSFQQFAYRLVCTNGLIGRRVRLSSRKLSVLQQHSLQSWEALQGRIHMLLKVPVVEPEARVKKLLTMENFEEPYGDLKVETPNVYGVVNTVTRLAQGRRDQLDLERFAGRIIEAVLTPAKQRIRETLFERSTV